MLPKSWLRTGWNVFQFHLITRMVCDLSFVMSCCCWAGELDNMHCILIQIYFLSHRTVGTCHLLLLGMEYKCRAKDFIWQIPVCIFFLSPENERVKETTFKCFVHIVIGCCCYPQNWYVYWETGVKKYNLLHVKEWRDHICLSEKGSNSSLNSG